MNMTHYLRKPSRRTSTRWLSVIVAALALAPIAQGFQSSIPGLRNLQKQTYSKRHIFGRDKDDEKGENESTSESERGVLPFFSRLLRKDEQETEAEQPAEESSSSTATSVVEKPVVTKKASEPKFDDLSPLEQAKILRAQAEKARLEAERMDAQLTLEKIGRLERELEHAKKVSVTSNVTAQVEIENLMRELDVLEAKMRGETVAIKPASDKPPPVSSSSTGKKDDPPKGDFFSKLPENIEAFDEKVFQGVLDEFKKSPDFMKKAMAAQVKVDFDDIASINATEVALRLDKMSRFDFSFGDCERPSFTAKDIDEMKQSLAKTNNWANGMTVDPRLKGLSGGNETEWALMALEYQYYMQKYAVGEEQLTSFVAEDGIFGSLAEQFNFSAADGTIDQFYPKCTRKEGREPTEAQVNQLMTEVLPKAKFTSTAKPEKVLGGYIVRGNSRYDSGDDLIQAIDEQLAKTSLSDKMTVLYARDFTVFSAENLDEPPDLSSLDPILYVVGKDIVREPRRVLLSLTSGFGLASCWYLSLYPFLLNPTLAARVDEELALVDAGMTPDLSWLTDLSIPLFATFVGIQIFHEMGHRIAAMVNGVRHGKCTGEFEICCCCLTHTFVVAMQTRSNPRSPRLFLQS